MEIVESETGVVIDARPALPVSVDSLWDHAAKKRDNIAAIIDSAFKEQNIYAWIRKSQPGEYPLYVVVESWIQKGETNRCVLLDRSSLKVTISLDPCRIHTLSYKAELDRHGRKYTGGHWELDDAELRELAVYLVQGGKKPKFLRPRLSLIERIGYPWLPPWERMANKLIPEARRNPCTKLSVLGWSGLLVAIICLAGRTDFTPQRFLVTLIAISALIAAVVMSHRRETVEAVPKQSLRTPRREFRVDSWHVSVPNAGEQFEQFRQRLYNLIRTKEPTIEMSVELHQRLTPRGYEERERLVLTKGQTTLHVHVYPFANHAFVGWESYLNWNRWEETAPISTTVRNGKKVNYRSLAAGVYIPTDFDLIEADVLAETTHRLLTDEIKAFLKEKEIEADLDFKIIRGDRANALKEGKDDKEKKTGW